VVSFHRFTEDEKTEGAGWKERKEGERTSFHPQSRLGKGFAAVSGRGKVVINLLVLTAILACFCLSPNTGFCR
jgi:mannose-6-phosphate isomerase-like protein (cupin superfamily)